jgi:hypothetical protein
VLSSVLFELVLFSASTESEEIFPGWAGTAGN